MNFLESLSDMGLRRLYKFVLKGAIGRYLEDDLLIEQLHVRSRDGMVTLSNICLNCDVLNSEILTKSPFRIVKAHLRHLEAKLSYTLLLAEGCQVHGAGLEITFVPSIPDAKNANSAHHQLEENNFKADLLEPAYNLENNYASEASNSLEYIARWIDIILASLQFHVTDIKIIILDTRLNADLVIACDKLSYYNSHPQSLNLSKETSASFSSKSLLQTGSSINFGNRKLILINGLKMYSVNRNESAGAENLVLSVPLTCSIQLKESKTGKIPTSECDVTIDPIIFYITAPHFPQVLEFVNLLFSGSSRAEAEQKVAKSRGNEAFENLMKLDPTVGALLWLQTRKKALPTKDNDIDYEMVMSIMAKNQLLKSKGGLEDNVHVADSLAMSESSVVAASTFIDDDDIQLPDEEDEVAIDEDDFFDADDGGSRFLRKGKSVRFLEDSSYIPPKQPKVAKESTVRIRLKAIDAICSRDIKPTSSQTRALQMSLQEVIIAQTKTYERASSGHELESSNHLTLTIADIKLFDKTISQNDDVKVSPWISFYHTDCDKKIIYPQHFAMEINIGVETDENQSSSSSTPLIPETNVMIKLEPVIVSITLSKLIEWNRFMTELLSYLRIQADPEAMVRTVMNLQVDEVHVLFHPEEAGSKKSTWEDYFNSLDIIRFPERWEILPLRSPNSNSRSLSHKIYDHFARNRSNAGVHVVMNDFSASLTSGPNQTTVDSVVTNSQRVSLSNLQIYLYANADSQLHMCCIHQSIILSALRDNDKFNSKVFIEYRAPSKEVIEPLSSGAATTDSAVALNQEGRVLYGDDEAIPEPAMNRYSLLHVYAYRIAIDVRQRELCAIVNLADYFIPTQESAVGVDVDRSINNKLNSSSNGLSIGVLFHSEIATIRISENLKSYTLNDVNVSDMDDDSMCLCLSVINPVIKAAITNVPKQQTFFSIQAEDMAMFEMTNKQFSEHFSTRDFRMKKVNAFVRNPRVGPQAFLVPFAHRTTLHSKSGKWHLSDKASSSNNEHIDDNNVQILPEGSGEHTFRLQLLLSDEPSDVSNEMHELTLKNVSIHMSFQDITLRYDPSSAWFIKAISLMTPLSPQQIIQRRQMNSPNLNGEEYLQSVSRKEASKSIFEVTKATVRVRKCLIDYCCEHAQSRLLFSVGMLSMSAMVTSSTPKFSVKFSVRDISLHITNRIYRRSQIEQSPLDPDGYRCEIYRTDIKDSIIPWIDMDSFLDEHLFVQLMTLNFMESFVTFHEDSPIMNQSSPSSAMSFKIHVGLCCIYACIDSMAVLSDTMLCWWQDFKQMIEKSNTTKFTKDVDNLKNVKSIRDDVNPDLSSVITEIQNDDLKERKLEKQEKSRDKRGIVTLADFGDSDDDTGPSKPSYVEASIVKSQKPQLVTYQATVMSRESVVDKAEPSMESSTKESTSQTPQPSLTGWMDRIQQHAFVVPTSVAAPVEYDQSTVVEQTNHSVIDDSLIRSGYYGNQSYIRPPSPEYETRWIPQYGDEIENNDDDDDVSFLVESLSAESSSSDELALPMDGLDASPDNNQSNFVDETTQFIDYQDIDDIDADMDRYEQLYPLKVVHEPEDNFLEDVQLDRSAIHSISKFNSNRSADPVKSVVLDDELNKSSFLENSVLIDDSDVAFDVFENDENTLISNDWRSQTFKHRKNLDESVSSSLREEEELADFTYLQSTETNVKDASRENRPWVSSFFPLRPTDPTDKRVIQDDREMDDLSLSKDFESIIPVIDSQIEKESSIISSQQFDRFDALDGVHTALKINIDDTVTFRQAGYLLTEKDGPKYSEDMMSLIDEQVKKSAYKPSEIPSDDNIVEEFMITSEPIESVEESASIAEAKSSNITSERSQIPLLEEDKFISVEQFNYLKPIAVASSEEVITKSFSVTPAFDNEIMEELKIKSILSYRNNIPPEVDYDFEMAWKDISIENNSGYEFRTRWYVDPSTVRVEQFHVPMPTITNPANDADNDMPDIEKILPISTIMHVKASLRLRLFGGADWSDSPTPSKSSNMPGKQSTDQTTTRLGSQIKTTVKKSKSKTPDGSMVDNANQPDERMSNPLLDSLLESKTQSSRKSVGISTNASSRLPATTVSRELFDRSPVKSVPVASNRKKKPSTLKTRVSEDMLDLSASGITVSLRVYSMEKYLERLTIEIVKDDDFTETGLNKESKTMKSLVSNIPPCQRLIFRVNDFLLSFQRFGHRRKKVLGWWKSDERPRESGLPIMNVILVGYSTKDPVDLYNSYKVSRTVSLEQNNVIHASPSSDTVSNNDNLEHRVVLALLPLRCYLDYYLVEFLKRLAEHQSMIDSNRSKKQSKSSDVSMDDNSENINDGAVKSSTNTSPDNMMYFQMISVRKFDIKIDYESAGVNLVALQNGDYLQLLNIFPLKGLTITLKRIRLTGVSGLTTLIEQLVYSWVDDIYQNQLHRVISGTSAFRGLANIGSDIKDLILVPLTRTSKKSTTSAANRKMARELHNKTTDLLQTVARETLHVSHKLTMYLAKGIVDLAADTPPVNQPMLTNQTSTRSAESNRQNRVRFENANQSPSNLRDSRQPNGLNEGLLRAYESMRREMSAVVDSVIAVPIHEYRRTGSSKSYVKSVVRALPVAVLRPIAGAAEGVSYTLLGLRNLIDPNARIEEEDIFDVDKRLQEES